MSNDKSRCFCKNGINFSGVLIYNSISKIWKSVNRESDGISIFRFVYTCSITFEYEIFADKFNSLFSCASILTCAKRTGILGNDPH